MRQTWPLVRLDGGERHQGLTCIPEHCRAVVCASSDDVPLGRMHGNAVEHLQAAIVTARRRREKRMGEWEEGGKEETEVRDSDVSQRQSE